jgi:sarcosine oxidase subunit beta
VVVGGGIAGVMAAHFVQTRIPRAHVTVLEQGNSVPYDYGTSTRSAACTRQQFGLEHNVEMSVFSTRFYEQMNRDVVPEQVFWQKGYLFLYRDHAKWSRAAARVVDQQRWGLGEVEALSPDHIVRRFPWASGQGLAGGTFCPTDGFLDPGLILTTLRDRIREAGGDVATKTVVTGFDTRQGAVWNVRTTSGDFRADVVVNCTGPWAARIGKMLGTELPVAPEKRYLWTATFERPEQDFSEDVFDRMPLTVCCGHEMTPYLKPEPGRNPHSFMLGCEHQVAPEWDFVPEDQGRIEPGFETNGERHIAVWEELASWLPYTEDLSFRRHVNAGYYETTPSHSPVIGADPTHANVIHCCGFSGHGIMHGPAAGATVADLIEHGGYATFPKAASQLSYASLMAGTRQLEEMKI